MYRYGNWVNRLNMNIQLQYVITKLAYLVTRLWVYFWLKESDILNPIDKTVADC